MGLWVGTVPLSEQDLKTLWDAGIRAVVTLQQRWEPQIAGGVGEACAAFGLEHLWVPTPDFSPPSQLCEHSVQAVHSLSSQFFGSLGTHTSTLHG